MAKKDQHLVSVDCEAQVVDDFLLAVALVEACDLESAYPVVITLRRQLYNTLFY